MTILPSKPRIINLIVTILKIPKLQDYSVLAVVVRELSKHQSAPSYPINESFCSITRCAPLHLVYHLIAVSMHFQCPELQVCLLSSPHYSYFEPKPEPAFELHFWFFNRIFLSHSVHDITVLTPQICKSVQVPFNV